MKQLEKRIKTRYIQLNTTKCKACWKCLEVCKYKVIGRINLPWHKHTLFVKGENCIGCLKCLSICDYNAILKLKNNEV